MNDRLHQNARADSLTWGVALGVALGLSVMLLVDRITKIPVWIPLSVALAIPLLATGYLLIPYVVGRRRSRPPEFSSVVQSISEKARREQWKEIVAVDLPNVAAMVLSITLKWRVISVFFLIVGEVTLIANVRQMLAQNDKIERQNLLLASQNELVVKQNELFEDQNRSAELQAELMRSQSLNDLVQSARVIRLELFRGSWTSDDLSNRKQLIQDYVTFMRMANMMPDLRELDASGIDFHEFYGFRESNADLAKAKFGGCRMQFDTLTSSQWGVIDQEVKVLHAGEGDTPKTPEQMASLAKLKEDG